MNSLEDLNNNSQSTTFTHDDDRDPQLIFDRASASNTTVTVNEGLSHTVPQTIEIIEVVNYDEMTSFYEIDISAVTGAILTWPTLPAHMTATTPSTGVYRLEGFRTVLDWEQVKNPTISLPNALSGEFDYTVDIGYTVDGVTTTKSFTVALTIIELGLWDTTTDYFWNISTSQVLTGTPQINDDGISTPTYTITVTPSSGTSINSMSSSGSGGTSSFNSGTKVLSIAGTQEQVNSHLINITLVSNTTEENYTLTYVVTTSLSETDTITQNLRCQQIRYLGVISTPTVTYDEDTSVSVSGGPQITDTDADGSGTYVLNISGTGVKTLSATGTGGSTSFNSGTKVLSIFGTRTEVNSYIDNITLFPKADFASNFNLTYALTTPTSATQSKSQLMQIGTLDPEVTGIDGVSRYYAKNTATFIFANTDYIDTSSNPQTLSQTAPQITDLDPETASYQVQLSCSSGETFSIDGKTEVTTLTLTGNKSEINSQITGVRFYGNKNSTANATITWTQTKNGSSHYSNSFVVSGIDTGATTFTTDYVLTTNQTWVPNIDSRRFSTNADIMLIGGGGAATYFAGGGGGGVRILTNSTALSTSTYTSYPIVIGAGGTPTAGYSTTSSRDINRGGTTTAFGLSAPGGEGGQWYDTTSNNDYEFIGGSSGTYNGSAGNTAFTSNYSLTQINNSEGAGPGGASAAQSDYNANFIKTGTNVQFISGNSPGSQLVGGSGGNAFEFPSGTSTWYGGGGGGGSLELRGPSHDDIDGIAAAGLSGNPPYPIKYNGGGGEGRGTSETANYYTLWTPQLPSRQQNGRANSGGGGGGGTTPDPTHSKGPGFGGSGVVVVRFNA